MARQNIGIGTTANDGTGDDLRTGGDKINDNFIELYSATGWASYKDTVYNSGSPFSVTEGDTENLLNNAGTIIDTYLPIGVTSLYNELTGHITPENIGDYYVLTVRFKAKNSEATGGYADIGLDLGGAIGLQFLESIIFIKGAGVEQNFSIAFPFYSLDTFVLNGARVKVNAINGNLQIYDIEYQIARTYKAL